MKRIIFLNRFFFPDHSATSQIVSALALHLAASGKNVHAITSRQLYDDPQARLPARETVNEVDVHRVSTTLYGRSRLLGRGIDYLSFYASMWRSVLAVARSGDILVAKTDPPLLSVLAMQAAKRCGAQLVNWLQDLYPEVAVQLGVPLLGGPLGQALAHMRDRSLKAAAANVVVGQRMAERVLARGAAPDRVHVIHNWSEDQCLTILGNCRRAMKPGSCLLIIEMVLPTGDAPHPGKMLNIISTSTRTGSRFATVLESWVLNWTSAGRVVT